MDTGELLDAAREYAIAEDRYQAACLRIAMTRGQEHVPAEQWDADTLAACKAANAAQGKLDGVCSRLFPQTERAELWEQYYAQFHGSKAVAP